MGLGPSIVSLFLAVSRHFTRTYSDKALEMMGQEPSYAGEFQSRSIEEKGGQEAG